MTQPDSGRHVIVGDVHGQRATLRRLLQVVDLDPRDTLVLVGDVVDRGADSVGAVRDLRALAARQPVVLVKGNHEFKHEKYRRNRHEDPRRAETTDDAQEIAAITATLDADDVAWLDASVLWARLPGPDALVVHGGIPPLMPHLVGDPPDAPHRSARAAVAAGSPRLGPADLWSLARGERHWAQQMLRMRWVRGRTRLDLTVSASLDLQPGDEGPPIGAEAAVSGRVERRKLHPRGQFLPLGAQEADDPYWADLYDGRWGHVYFGHNPFSDRDRPVEFDHATALDLGAVYGNRLAAAVLQPGREPELVTVAAAG